MSNQDLFHSKISQKMFRGDLLMAIMVFIFGMLYTNLYYGEYSLLQTSGAVAFTCATMIGSSFAMSGMAYYFDFLDRRLAYRKYMGIIGYFFAMTYSVMLLFIDPDTYFYGFFKNFWTADFILGLSAMAILTMMFVISNNTVMKKLGPKLWRGLLRTGYVAIALFVIRGFILEWDSLWLPWLQTFDGLMPPRLLVSTFGTLVILFRISVSISKFIKKHHSEHI